MAAPIGNSLPPFPRSDYFFAPELPDPPDMLEELKEEFWLGFEHYLLREKFSEICQLALGARINFSDQIDFEDRIKDRLEIAKTEGDYDKARLLASASVILNPSYPSSKCLEALGYFKAGHFQSAWAILKSLPQASYEIWELIETNQLEWPRLSKILQELLDSFDPAFNKPVIPPPQPTWAYPAAGEDFIPVPFYSYSDESDESDVPDVIVNGIPDDGYESDIFS